MAGAKTDGWTPLKIKNSPVIKLMCVAVKSVRQRQSLSLTGVCGPTKDCVLRGVGVSVALSGYHACLLDLNFILVRSTVRTHVCTAINS